MVYQEIVKEDTLIANFTEGLEFSNIEQEKKIHFGNSKELG